jgi:acetyl-CoA acyltransferase
MSRPVYVAGAASTRFGKFLDTGLRALAQEAAAGALADAGGTPDAVEAVFFSNAAAGVVTGQEMIRGEIALRDSGLLGRPIVNVENACASGSTAFHLAWVQVASGLIDVALVVGAEKLTHPDKERSFAAFNGAVDVEEYPAAQMPANRSLFMDLYAGMAREYMNRTGAQVEHLAQVAVKAHHNGVHNEMAQYRDEVTAEEVLGARTIADPLTLLMCAPIGDGASALVLASDKGLERLDADPVAVRATVVLAAEPGREEELIGAAAERAYRMAEIRPDDVDVVELHDAAASAELSVPEELGLAPQDGGGVELLRSGASSLKGSLPINPSGGLLSKGHPIGATGCAQIAELVDQLRGRCGKRQVREPEIALAENAGGWLRDGPAVATITILGRRPR